MVELVGGFYRCAQAVAHHREGLFRQRMDFLLLLPIAQRVVLEVDGSHHFSADGRASLELYGQMVAADREFRLLG